MFDEDYVDLYHGSLPVSNNDCNNDEQHNINDNMFVTQQEGQQQEAFALEHDVDMSDVGIDIAGAGVEDAAMMMTPPPTTMIPPTQQPPTFQLMNRLPVLLSLSCDPIKLSKYQCLLRKQLELFEATHEYLIRNARGRNKPIVLGQVGLRCRHCACNPTSGSTLYPTKLIGIYQASQNIGTTHILGNLNNNDDGGNNSNTTTTSTSSLVCTAIPDDIRIELQRLYNLKETSGGGRELWARHGQLHGVYEDEYGLRFTSIEDRYTADEKFVDSRSPLS